MLCDTSGVWLVIVIICLCGLVWLPSVFVDWFTLVLCLGFSVYYVYVVVSCLDLRYILF